MHLLQSQGHIQGHLSVHRQEQQHDFIFLILESINTLFFFNIRWLYQFV